MAYKIGTATDYKDLLSKLKDFVTTPNELSAVTPGGGNVGGGDVSDVSAADDAPTETWTLTCTSGGATGTFSVVGSVSGAQADATVGTPYDNGIVAFTINDGDPDFAIDDSFTFDVTQIMGEDAWTAERWDTDYDGNGGYELILNGPGSGDDEIFVGIQTYFDSGDAYYNWRLNGFTGYSAVAAWADQPGVIPNNSTCYRPQLCLWNSSIPYWFVANGRRIAVIAKVEDVIEPCYLGWPLAYGVPTQSIPYTLVIGGSAPSNLTGEYKRYSATAPNAFQHSAFVDPAGGSGEGSLCVLHGSTWLNFRNWSSEDNQYVYNTGNVWPFMHSDYNYSSVEENSKYVLLQQNIDGSYPLFPLILVTNSPNDNFLGELQGLYAVPGFGIASQDTIEIGAITYVVFKNIYRSSTYKYFALKLE